MEHIDAKSLSISELLDGKKYTLGYFQREYNWKKDNVVDLINDLFSEFLKNHNDESENANSKDFFYFLGSIIVSDKNQELSLIDGQQRLTTLSLILIWIANTYEPLAEKIMPLVIYKTENDRRTYTLDAKERKKIMNALCDKEIDKINVDDELTSIQNIKSSFEEIENNIRSYEFDDTEMELFVNWLKNKVYVAEIKVSSTQDGYKVFESANDRGLNLSPVDMLKSYLLSNVDERSEQIRLDKIWQEQVDKIVNSGEFESDAIKYWLRSKSAQSHRDFDDIGGEFHRWIKNKSKILEINTSEDFINLVKKDFCFYTDWYIKLREMAKTYKPENEAIYCNQNFTLMYMVILSTITQEDDENTILKKINVVATFIDIFIARHLWNGQASAIGQNRARIVMFEITKNIRDKNLTQLVAYLQDKIEDYDEFDFTAYNLPRKKETVRQFLARFSAWLDAETNNNNTNFPFYADSKNFDIEHIVPDQYEWYENIRTEEGGLEFEDDIDFQQHRNLFGALLLLPPPFNRSYGHLPYEEKLEHYCTPNMILAKTLHSKTYEKNPDLERLRERIPFEPHKQFLKADIKKRNRVYMRIAKNIWNPTRIKQAAE